MCPATCGDNVFVVSFSVTVLLMRCVLFFPASFESNVGKEAFSPQPTLKLLQGTFMLLILESPVDKSAMSATALLLSRSLLLTCAFVLKASKQVKWENFVLLL